MIHSGQFGGGTHQILYCRALKLNQMPEIVISEQVDLTRQKISEWLGEATQSAGYTYSPEHLLLQVVDDNGDIIGGLAGATNWNWLYIETLAIAPQHRNRGYARQ